MGNSTTFADNADPKVNAAWFNAINDIVLDLMGEPATLALLRSNIGLKIDTNVQAFDAGLLSIAGLTTLADRMIYTTAMDVYAVAPLTAAGRALLDDASASAQRTTLGVVIGTDVLPEISLVSQADAEAGTATAEKTWSALRVAQAIAALETGGGGGDLHQASDAGTNAIVKAVKISHITSDTAAAGFGVGAEFELEGADGTNLIAGGIDVVWTDPATGAEDSDMIFSVSLAGAAAVERMRLASDGRLAINYPSGLSKPPDELAVYPLSGGTGSGVILHASASGGNRFEGRGSRGTIATPSASLLNDQLVGFDAKGYGATGWAGDRKAQIGMYAAENWTDAAQGTYIKIRTTPKGSTSMADRVWVDDAGRVGIGVAPAASIFAVLGLPTSAAGLANGDIWSNNGVLIDATSSGDASLTAKGITELATTAEIDTGTDTARTVTPDKLAGSYAGTKSVSWYVVEATVDNAVGDGQSYFVCPPALDGMNLVNLQATVVTAGVTGTQDIQLYNVTQAADILSTKVTIDTTETSSRTAATPPVIDTANDDVAAGDVLRADIDAIHTTAAKGLLLDLEFRLP